MNSRRQRGLQENIFLVKIDVNPTILAFHILGTTNHVYKIFCKQKMKPTCTCPDYCTRKQFCKHIYFVCEKVIQIEPSEWQLVEEIQIVSDSILKRLPHLDVFATDYYVKTYDDYVKGKKEAFDEIYEDTHLVIRNEECCICLCEIESISSENVIVCPTCRNGLHLICWNKWKQMNKNKVCVYCRASIDKYNKKFATIISDSGWGVLLE